MTDHAFLFMRMGLRQTGHGMTALTPLLHLLAALALFQLGKKCLVLRVVRHIGPELFVGAEQHNKEYCHRASAKGQVFSG
jgi:hypothetical protein